MKVQKITEKYNLIQDGVTFTVDMGNVKNAEDKTVELVISGVEDSSKITLKATCGCTTTEQKTLNKESLSVKLTYKDCDLSFAKIVVVKYSGAQLGLIKLTGRCQ